MMRMAGWPVLLKITCMLMRWTFGLAVLMATAGAAESSSLARKVIPVTTVDALRAVYDQQMRGVEPKPPLGSGTSGTGRSPAAPCPRPARVGSS